LSRFCRHNRFVSECSICSKGTVLDADLKPERPRRSGGSRAQGATRPAAARSAVTGPYGSAGPYSGDDGQYEVRLERIAGGLRLGVWAAGSLQRRAPVLPADDMDGLLRSAVEGGAILAGDLPQGAIPGGVSRGRSGEFRDELRVELLEDGNLRIARWVMRPSRGWELQEAPVMLPAARFAEALKSGSAASARLV
jgi:hypothetical protein